MRLHSNKRKQCILCNPIYEFMIKYVQLKPIHFQFSHIFE